MDREKDSVANSHLHGATDRNEKKKDKGGTICVWKTKETKEN